MHQNKIWLTFLGCLLAITLFYSGKALYFVYQYVRLTAVTEATSVEWSIQEKGSEEYIPFARYVFSVKGKEYQGEDALSHNIFRNEWAAKEELPKLAKQKWKVWYRASSPEQSALQKIFPLKECLSAVALIVIGLYFVGLGYYVARLPAQSLPRKSK